ncbi:MAG: carboxypeptidase regulatory-like domain-containing protein, partial [Proteobacteria bacterium]|nr:carboxypeptidase regulatory-like domain-containing protein [Pseudomonadota bacterium]
MKKLAMLAAFLMLAPAVGFFGCADNENNGPDTNAAPTKSYFGTVRDTAGNKLVGVEVCFEVKGKSKCTKTRADDTGTARDESGMYSVDGIPFDSDVRLTANFATADVTYFPLEFTFWSGSDEVIGEGDQLTYQSNTQEERNLIMVAGNYTLTGQVFANGVPAAGATVVLDLRHEGFPIYTTGTVADDGTFTFEGLPAPSLERGIDYEVWVLPWDKDGDGSADFEATWREFDPFWQAANKLVFNLMGDDGYMNVIFSDVEDGRHTSGDPITVVFDQVINQADVWLEDVTGYNFPIAVTTEIVGGIKLVITPVK